MPTNQPVDKKKCQKCGKYPCICPKAAAGTGKIILLCGTSTAGKTSICTAAKDITSKWVVEGVDATQDRAWNESSKIGGKDGPSGREHYTLAMKEYVSHDVVDRAVEAFDARTLTIALFSRSCLGNPKVDKVDLTPESDIKIQSKKIHKQLSEVNQKKYSPENIEDLLFIIRECPKVDKFILQHPYPPLEDSNDKMLEQAVTRAVSSPGESLILDVIGNEKAGGIPIAYQLKQKAKDAGLPEDTVSIVVAHCPLNILRERIEQRNIDANAEGRTDDVRQAFFPFEQYGALYEKASNQIGDHRPIVGEVNKKDIIAAAAKYGDASDARLLLHNLGFNDGEDTIKVVAKVPRSL
tara:strand:- start:33 stop:1088 length:1056 start_codon:yes stop_codon:yes gene_type:complete